MSIDTIRLADRMQRIALSPTMKGTIEAEKLRRQGVDVVDLGAGEPDFPTPPHVVAEGQRALADGWTKYGPTPGLPELRASIAAYISRTRRVQVGPENVCVVPFAPEIRSTVFAP